VLTTPQFNEQTLDVVVTDTELVSASVAVVVDKNRAPELTRTPVAGEDAKLKLVIEGEKDGTINSPTWAASDADKHSTYFYFQLKAGERAGDANVEVIDGKRLSLISNDGRFSINKLTGLVTANTVVLTTPQFNEQTLDVVVTDTELVSAPVAVVVDKNHVPELTRNLAVGEDLKLTLFVSGAEDGKTSLIDWKATDADVGHKKYFYFQLNEGERVGQNDVKVVNGNRLSLISGDGRFTIDMSTGQIKRTDLSVFAPQMADQDLKVVVTDSELVSAASVVTIEKNFAPTLTLAETNLTLAANENTIDIPWVTGDNNDHGLFFYFEVAEGAPGAMNVNGRFLSMLSEDGRFKIDSASGQIIRTVSDEEDPADLCKTEAPLSVVVTDSEFVSEKAIVVNIERILPTFTDAASVDPEDPAWTSNNEYFFRSTDEERTINESLDGAVKGADLLKIVDITNFENIDFAKTGDNLNDLQITVTYGPNAIEQTDPSPALALTDTSPIDPVPEVVLNDASIVLGYQFGIPEELESETAKDYRIEYLRFAEGAEFKGFVLNSSIEYKTLDETGVYRIQAGAEGSHCQDLLVSYGDSDKASTLNGGDGNDLLFAYGLNDTLNGGEDHDLLVAHDTGNTLNGDEGNDTSVTYGTKNSSNGGIGNDTLFAYADENTLNGGAGTDTLIVKSSNSLLNGDAGNDLLNSMGDDNHLNGGEGDDGLEAFGSNSSLKGDAGNDILFADGANSNLDGGTGNDTLFAEGEYSNLDGGEGDDFLDATANNSSLIGGAGNDNLYAFGDYSHLNGGEGNDFLETFGNKNSLVGGAGNDTLYAFGEDSMLEGGTGNDKLYVNANYGTANGGQGNDLITLGDGVSGTSLILKDNGESNFDTIINFNESGTIHLNGYEISFNGKNDKDKDNDNDGNDGVGKIRLKLDQDPLAAYLKSEENDLSYLITVTGTDADIWYVNHGSNGVSLDKVAHFVDFNFYNYSAAVIPV